ncbi:hypothetical protein QUF72_11435 [Desulfobacterales bacterium HSG2]|nr:hypothetical protein [Desulfobacterales bacterium HSG2]
MAQGTVGAIAAGAVPSTPAVAAGTGTNILGTVKAAVISPVFGIVVLAGIIGYELWKGKKDSQEIEAVANGS